MPSKPDLLVRTIQAGILAWLLPGAGHLYLGMRSLGFVYLIAISFAYLTGVLIGGVKTSVDPVGNFWLFLAELGCGGYTGVFYLVASRLETVPVWKSSPYVSYYPAADVAQIYLAVAGLLNVLAILDALARAQTGGLPVFHYEQLMKERAKAQAIPSQPVQPLTPENVARHTEGK
jgi:hypothetical protein